MSSSTSVKKLRVGYVPEVRLHLTSSFLQSDCGDIRDRHHQLIFFAKQQHFSTPILWLGEKDSGVELVSCPSEREVHIGYR